MAARRNPLELERRARLSLEAARLRRSLLADAARAASTVSTAAAETRSGIESLYLTPRDRLRVALGLTGIGAAAASLALGAAAPPLAAARIANNLISILRAGRRLRATRDASLGLAQLLDEILA